METLVLVLVLSLAFVNGANDNPKGVATLAGSGVTRLRPALIWGTATTAVGCLISLQFASKMTALFSNGIVSATPTAPFAAAVLTGTAAWVALATWRKLPVSTTHAIVGSLLGAGALFASSAVQWNVLLVKVVQPLLLSIAVAYAVSAALSIAGGLVQRKLSARRVAAVRAAPPGAASVRTAVGTSPETADVTLDTETRSSAAFQVVSAAHWITSGLTSLARGMNDTPKIVAIGSFALVAGMTPSLLAIAVTIAMAAGGLLVGSRIAERMAKDVIRMSHLEGFTANLTTSVLVGLGATQGLPMSTTQVSTGAIAGTAGATLSRLSGKTVRDFAIAWLATPPFAATVAALAYLVLR